MASFSEVGTISPGLQGMVTHAFYIAPDSSMRREKFGDYQSPYPASSIFNKKILFRREKALFKDGEEPLPGGEANIWSMLQNSFIYEITRER